MIIGQHLEKNVFVLSTGRTGTKAIAKYFNENFDNVIACHEPKPSRILRICSNLYLSNKISFKTLTIYLSFCRFLSLKKIEKGKIYIETNPFLYGFIDVFNNNFLNVKIVHVTRHPATYIRSYINYGVFRGFKGFVGDYFPYWLIKPDYFTNTALTWRKMSYPERLLWSWNFINCELDRGKSVYGHNYTHVKFEDLFDKKKEGLNFLSRWIGLKPSPKLMEDANTIKVNASKDYGFPELRQWEESLKDRVVYYCGDLMKKYDYHMNF